MSYLNEYSRARLTVGQYLTSLTTRTQKEAWHLKGPDVTEGRAQEMLVDSLTTTILGSLCLPSRHNSFFLMRRIVDAYITAYARALRGEARPDHGPAVDDRGGLVIEAMDHGRMRPVPYIEIPDGNLFLKPDGEWKLIPIRPGYTT